MQVIQYGLSIATALVLVTVYVVGVAVCVRHARQSPRLWIVAIGLSGMALSMIFGAVLLLAMSVNGPFFTGMESLPFIALVAVSGISTCPIFLIGLVLFLLDARNKLAEGLPPSVVAANAARDGIVVDEIDLTSSRKDAVHEER